VVGIVFGVIVGVGLLGAAIYFAVQRYNNVYRRVFDTDRRT
jgi:hypothetical protein